MIVQAILGAASCMALAGCTHHQLTRSTVLSTGTVIDIQYRTVLMNLALLSSHPEALPSHIDLADGVVQVNDEAAFGTAGGFSSTGSRFGIDQFGPAGSRQVTEQWSTDAITDPQRLTGLQDLYRVALDLPPLPPPNAVAYLRLAEAEKRKKGGGDQGGSDPSPSRVLSETSPGEGGSIPSSGSGSADGDGDRSVPIEVLLTDVPHRGGSTWAARKTFRRTPATWAGMAIATPG